MFPGVGCTAQVYRNEPDDYLAAVDEDEWPDICPDCGFNLEEDGWPVRHQDDDGDECPFVCR